MRDYIESLLQGIAEIGCGENGWNRIGFSEADREGRAWFSQKMREAGLVVRTDAFGNIFGRLEGHDPALPAVATGSHMDTVPNGGNYDGVLGCVAGLAAIYDIKMAGGLRHPLELILFQIEESSRFACSTLGSKILTGRADMEYISGLIDKKQMPLPEVMENAGFCFDKNRLKACALPQGAYRAFIELHMDQGPELEDANIPLGVVTGIVGVRRARIYFHGRALHAGATPMKNRKNALNSAARAALELETIAASLNGLAGMVATTGNIIVEPGAINVIPAKAMLHCEMRAGDDALLRESWAKFENSLHKIAKENGTPLEIVITESSEPVLMDEEVRDSIKEACQWNSVNYMDMASGAGHDCMNMASIMPSGMIFVRNVDGISHHKNEYVRPEDALAACKVLRESLIALGK